MSPMLGELRTPRLPLTELPMFLLHVKCAKKGGFSSFSPAIAQAYAQNNLLKNISLAKCETNNTKIIHNLKGKSLFILWNWVLKITIFFLIIMVSEPAFAHLD